MLKNKFKKQQFFLLFFKRDLRKFGDPEENAQNLEFRINPGKSQPYFNGNIWIKNDHRRVFYFSAYNYDKKNLFKCEGENNA